MMTIQELRRFAGAMSAQQFAEQLGPFVLVQSPPADAVQKMARMLGARATFRGEDLKGSGMAEMIAKFDDLSVATLPPVRDRDALDVGRLPNNELVIEDPTVSKRHATLWWEHGKARVEDLLSRNGTFVNGVSAKGTPLSLQDGDYVNFGDASFLFFHSETLYLRVIGTDETTFTVEDGPANRGQEIQLVSIADTLWGTSA